MIAAVVFFLIPVAVAHNTFGFADKLSRLPGISKGGGVVSGVAAAVLVSVAAGVVAGGGMVGMGSDLPLLGGNEDTDPVDPGPETPMPETPTPRAMPEPTPTPDPTATIEPTPEPGSLADFEQGYRTRVNSTWEDDRFTDIPILGTEYRENDQGQMVLWIVFWECDEADPLAGQRITIANDYVNSIGNHNGEQPDRLRVYGVTDLVNYEDTITYIETSEAQDAWDRNITEDTYTNIWWDRIHEPSQAENQTAYDIAVEDSGQERADRAFYDDHVEVDGCPAGTGTGDDSNQNNAMAFSVPGGAGLTLAAYRRR